MLFCAIVMSVFTLALSAPVPPKPECILDAALNNYTMALDCLKTLGVQNGLKNGTRDARGMWSTAMGVTEKLLQNFQKFDVSNFFSGLLNSFGNSKEFEQNHRHPENQLKNSDGMLQMVSTFAEASQMENLRINKEHLGNIEGINRLQASHVLHLEEEVGKAGNRIEIMAIVICVMLGSLLLFCLYFVFKK